MMQQPPTHLEGGKSVHDLMERAPVWLDQRLPVARHARHAPQALRPCDETVRAHAKHVIHLVRERVRDERGDAHEASEPLVEQFLVLGRDDKEDRPHCDTTPRGLAHGLSRKGYETPAMVIEDVAHDIARERVDHGPWRE